MFYASVAGRQGFADLLDAMRPQPRRKLGGDGQCFRMVGLYDDTNGSDLFANHFVQISNLIID